MNEPILAEALLRKLWMVVAAAPVLTGILIGWLIRSGRKKPNAEHEEARRIAEEQAWLAKRRNRTR